MGPITGAALGGLAADGMAFMLYVAQLMFMMKMVEAFCNIENNIGRAVRDLTHG